MLSLVSLSCLTLSHLNSCQPMAEASVGISTKTGGHSLARPLKLRQAENLRLSYGPQSLVVRQAENLRLSYGPQSLVVQQPRDSPGRGTVSSASFSLQFLPCYSVPLCLPLHTPALAIGPECHSSSHIPPSSSFGFSILTTAEVSCLL